MRALHFQGKIILPTVIISALLVIILTVFSVVNFSGFTDYLQSERITVTAKSLKTHLEESRNASITAAATSAADPGVIKAIRERDTGGIIKLLSPSFESRMVNFYTVCDSDGIVLARTHEPLRWGDSVLDQKNIRDALSGKVGSYYESGTMVKVSVRSGAPVYDTDGSLIGVVSAGLRIDQNEVVDALKERYNIDCTVFAGDTRVATTVMIDGERAVGTKLDPDIANIVIGQKREYYGHAKILGEYYSTFYMPLLNSDNDVFAIFFAGLSREALIIQTNALIRGQILIGLLGLAVSILVMMIIGARIIKPVNRLVRLVSEVSRGNVDIATDRPPSAADEIGVLTRDIYSLIDIIKMILSDLSLLIRTPLTHAQTVKEFSADNGSVHRIDTGKYHGSYLEMTRGINALIDAVPEINKTMAVMDYMDTMLCIIDMDYNLLFVNRGLEKAYGVNREHCLRQKCYKILQNYDQPCPYCLLPELLSLKETFPSKNYTNQRDEALGTWVSGRAAIVRWIDGSFVFFHSQHDVTTEKTHEEQLSHARRAAEEASCAKSNFLAAMSHEMRTPLNVIIGISELVMEKDGVPLALREDIQKINSAGVLLLGIVNDILDISKMEAGKLELMPVSYHTPGLLNDVIMLNMNRVESKPIQFSIEISEDLPGRLYGDDLRVKQICNNLLSNAFKYTQAGTVTLKVFAARGSKKDVWLFITVSDTGTGIKPEDLRNVFTNHDQANAHVNCGIEGAGLGLSITRKLVEMMDGEISVKSEWGTGSAFHVRIRQEFLDEGSIGAAVVKDLSRFRYTGQRPGFSKIARPDLSFARVLVVDDFPANLYIADGMLSKYKMKVDCASGGQEAIDRIRNSGLVYNAVFMDHMMPGMDGIETARLIRSMGTRYARNIPIIALTAGEAAGNEQMLLENGFQAFISKPLNTAKLDAVVRQWIPQTAEGIPKCLRKKCYRKRPLPHLENVTKARDNLR